MPPPAPIDFFNEPKLVSLHKLDLFGKYLIPLTYKWGSGWRRIWIVDGFAGAGAYGTREGTRVDDGSPLIAARWARRIALQRGYSLLRCINVERDPACYEQLIRHLAPWQDLASNRFGEFADHLESILQELGRDPAFFFLDPFGVNGIEIASIEKILARPSKTELLIHFSDHAFKRMAGHVADNGQRLPVGTRVAGSKLARLDAVIGTKLWRPRWEGSHVDHHAAMEATAELYLSQLRERGFKHTHQIRMRDHHGHGVRYRLVFCTNSPHGVELMSDIACRYERDLREQSAAGARTLWQDREEHAALVSLRERVHAVGLSRTTMSQEEIIHRLAPKYFGQHTGTEYAKAIRDLVSEGGIERMKTVGIKRTERLRFVPLLQQSLLAESS